VRALGWLVVALLSAWPAGTRADEAVWDALRQPGSVVVLRHSYAPGGFDPPAARLDDCTTQRNLDDNGRAQAGRVGEAFRANAIAVGAVLSSPRCRCLDTAQLAFAKVEPWVPLQGSLNDADLRRRQLAEIRQKIEAHQSGPPLVLVTHGSVVADLTGRQKRVQDGHVGRHAPGSGPVERGPVSAHRGLHLGDRHDQGGFRRFHR